MDDRVDEIRQWLTLNNTAKAAWIAIDDMDLLMMNPGNICEENFIHTSDETGLT